MAYWSISSRISMSHRQSFERVFAFSLKAKFHRPRLRAIAFDNFSQGCRNLPRASFALIDYRQTWWVNIRRLFRDYFIYYFWDSYMIKSGLLLSIPSAVTVIPAKISQEGCTAIDIRAATFPDAEIRTFIILWYFWWRRCVTTLVASIYWRYSSIIASMRIITVHDSH